MSKTRFAPILRAPIRLVISILALVTGLYHVSNAVGSPTSGGAGVPAGALLVPQSCGGDGGNGGGGDYCDPSHLDSNFCPCTQEPCFGGDGGGGDCYYGWNYWGDCGGGGGPM
jgi:hypothetical protein